MLLRLKACLLIFAAALALGLLAPSCGPVMVGVGGDGYYDGYRYYDPFYDGWSHTVVVYDGMWHDGYVYYDGWWYYHGLGSPYEHSYYDYYWY